MGLRPGTPDNVPAIGAGALDGLAWATGHYRNGILLGTGHGRSWRRPCSPGDTVTPLPASGRHGLQAQATPATASGHDRVRARPAVDGVRPLPLPGLDPLRFGCRGCARSEIGGRCRRGSGTSSVPALGSREHDRAERSAQRRARGRDGYRGTRRLGLERDTAGVAVAVDGEVVPRGEVGRRSSLLRTPVSRSSRRCREDDPTDERREREVDAARNPMPAAGEQTR